MNRHIFVGMQILNHNQWLKEHAVVVEDGTITAIISAHMVTHHLPANMHHFPENYYLSPGLIDLHIHGAANHDVMDGRIEALHAISRSLASKGITGFLATTMTASNDQLEAALRTIPLAMQTLEGAEILGVHLEGPFLSKEKIGAQNSRYVQHPNIALIHHWQKIACDTIKLITLAPELPHAIEFIQQLDTLGILASIGHTNATYEETRSAIQAGCKHATHLFNAMHHLHQREPGAIGALLMANDVTAELIVDGIHLHPAIVELALRCKSKENLVLVSDAMRATCLGDGQFDLGGQLVEVTRGKASLSDGTLAGSTLCLPQAIKNMQQFTHCSLIDAITMASFNPARILHLDRRKGSIEIGKDADLIILNEACDVILTMRGGKELDWR
ncbi:MAG: N-acetylglucosamine-6-phosphate deacetylase [Gammaproteobacteria bacterium RIFCSPHIGHO2_12_FULL_37_34]|nr:MAG: N-acetylglucosamine-6-phosphate deacetylase [Gammaproteobacteria bacterium RIFCSPHIGHO2_12_FULL_37_34]